MSNLSEIRYRSLIQDEYKMSSMKVLSNKINAVLSELMIKNLTVDEATNKLYDEFEKFVSPTDFYKINFQIVKIGSGYTLYPLNKQTEQFFRTLTFKAAVKG